MKKIFLFLFSVFTFAALHMMNVGGGLTFHDAFVQSVNTIPFGLIAGFLFLRTRNISALIFWHMFFDYILFAEHLGMYVTTALFSYAVDAILILSLFCAAVQMVSGWMKNRK